VERAPVTFPTARTIVAIAAFAALTVASRPAEAQQVVLISLPAGVTFNVSNVNQSTTGSPNPTTVSFTIVNLLLFHVLRASIKADADFTPPSGTAIPASRVSWTTTGADGAVGTSGTLGNASYSQVFQTNSGLLDSGSIGVRWTLSAPGTGVRAGNHTVTVRWRFESILP
jgi:hypothetical protein